MSFLEKARALLNENPFLSNFRVNRTRPPGAVPEKNFMTLCIRCARCIAVCPYQCIERAGASDGMQVGTPYIYSEKRACYMCMLCTQVCPTGALVRSVTEPEDSAMGIARINPEICLNYLYAKDEAAGKTDGYALYCNTCYNTCPLQGKAIYLENLVLPIVTDACTGCGVCLERCPTAPRSIEIIPTGMADAAKAGLYHLRKRPASSSLSTGVLSGEELIKEKEKLGSTEEFIFEYNFNTDNVVREWE